jgi:hypothetical protein
MLKGSQVGGVVKIILALALYFFATSHSPHTNFWGRLNHLNDRVLSEPAYDVIMILSALLGIVGAVNLFNSFQNKAKR